MARVSPMIRSFNAGEFSALVEGRPDLERAPSSMRRLFNFVAAPQGPGIARSGTMFMCPCYSHDTKSVIVPFIFNEEQTTLLEFAPGRIRFITEAGLQVYAEANATLITTAPFVVDVPTVAMAVGDEFVLSGYPEDYNLNGEVARVTSVVGTNYTLNMTWPVGKANVNAKVSKVYTISCDFTNEQREYINALQSVDVLYLLTGDKPRKLARMGAYDWRLTDVEFIDGPYMPVNDTGTTLTPSGTGSLVPDMTANNAPAGYIVAAATVRPAIAADGPFLGRSRSYALSASQVFHAFDADPETYYAAGLEQVADMTVEFASAKVIDGYVIFAAKDNRDTSYVAKDFAPSTWTLEGSNDPNPDASLKVWTILDSQESYVLYDKNKSIFFEVNNAAAYKYVRFHVTGLVRNGQIECRMRRITFREKIDNTFTITASATSGINKDAGFKATDVGRLLRVRGGDGTWRALEITAFTSSTVVTVKLKGEPLPDTKPIRFWRLGYWSDTTGWPTCGDFFDDRLALGGSVEAPDMFAMSVVQDYENFAQQDTFGVVLDDSAIVASLNARKLSRIQWMETDEKGLLIGTGSSEYILTSAKGDTEEITARNIKARNSTSRGSARVQPVKIDRQVLFIQRSGRTMREFAYAYEADGYKAPSMSQLASHIGAKRIVEIDYAAEPYSIIWCRREDGSLVGLTYNREENVIGWHTHDISGAIIESIAVMPQMDQLQDTLWLACRRTIDGQTRRYIERLTRFWDFDMSVDEAHFVDCALRYEGDERQTFYGLSHLEGREVYGLADRIPFGPYVVTDGSITLDLPASNVIIGLGFDAEGETSRMDNGAQDGTAFGKTKRIHQITPGVWESYGGEVGTWNPNVIDPVTNKPGTIVYNPIEYPDGRGDEIEGVVLYTGEALPLTTEPGYEKKGSVAFRRRKSTPLPFNVTYLAPQMVTQDGG